MAETIGGRAAQEIENRVLNLKNGSGKLAKELKRIGIPYGVFYAWKNGKYDPSAFYLQVLHFAGYDVIYLLTGERI